MLYLTEDDIRRLLPMREAVRLMRETFQALAAGAALNQPRRRLFLPTGSVLHSMAGAFGDYFGTKIYSAHARHGAHFFFLLFDAANAQPLALMEASHLGQIRTGAASGYATGLMALPDAATLAIIGSGFQARTQLEAILAVRSIREARVWSRTPDKRQRFAAEASAQFAIPVTAAGSAEAAVRGAEIIVTATWSKDPVLETGWVHPQAHVNAMGSNRADRRELPAGLLERASLIAVDSIEQSRIEAGELLLAWSEADWHSPRLVELKDLAAGWDRRSRTGITIFKSNGLGVEDVAAGAYVYEKAKEAGIGRSL